MKPPPMGRGRRAAENRDARRTFSRSFKVNKGGKMIGETGEIVITTKRIAHSGFADSDDRIAILAWGIGRLQEMMIVLAKGATALGVRKTRDSCRSVHTATYY